MRKPWQFDLKAMLGVVAALAVIFWMLASQDAEVVFFGLVLLPPVLGGCVGYLAIGWAGIWPGACLAGLLEMALIPLGWALLY